MQRERLPSTWRRFLHVDLVLLGWVVYFGFWWKVLRGPTGLGPLFIVIPVIIVVVPAVTLFWIFHNLRLYRARDARRSSPQIPDRYASDWEGRKVEANWTQVRAANEIDIRSDGPVKHYEAPATGEGPT